MSWPPKPASNGSFLTSLAWFYIDHCRLTVPFPVLERNQWLTEFPTSFNFETSNKQNIYNMSPEKSCFFWMHFPDRKKHEKKHVPFFFFGGTFVKHFEGRLPTHIHPAQIWDATPQWLLKVLRQTPKQAIDIHLLKGCVRFHTPQGRMRGCWLISTRMTWHFFFLKKGDPYHSMTLQCATGILDEGVL